jgi:hypothetical protein
MCSSAPWPAPQAWRLCEDAGRNDLVVNFIDKMTTDMREKNPDLAVKIRNWFAVTPAGREFPEGFERLAVEIGALQMAAKDGKGESFQGPDRIRHRLFRETEIYAADPRLLSIRISLFIAEPLYL